jgi:putative AdoMet-dependent methyltransferase
MRSAYGDFFNHDDEADGYDRSVEDVQDPIRTGYDDVLRWVIQEGRIDSTSRVLELGSGTGNLSALIDICSELVCVDLSARMEAIARPKLTHLANRRFIKADILEVFSFEIGRFDAVISSYAVHHLTPDEKHRLFQCLTTVLLPGGRAVFGDLMLQKEEEQAIKIGKYLAKGDRSTAEAIGEEFFWLLDSAVSELAQLGFAVDTKRFSDLSYGLAATWKG